MRPLLLPSGFMKRIIRLALVSIFIGILWYQYSQLSRGFAVPWRVSLIVPSVLEESDCLSLLLKSLEKCTTFPSETIVVVSGVDFRGTVQLQKFFLSVKVPNLRLITRKDNHTQDANRNFGASLAKYEYISFFDGDDYIHPQRFELLQRAFLDYPEVQHILHTFATSPPNRTSLLPQSSYQVLYTPDVLRSYFMRAAKNDSFYWTWCCSFMPPDGHNDKVHNGWGTFERSVFQTIPQSLHITDKESNNTAFMQHGAYEDSLHNSRIIRSGFNVMVLKNALGIYLQGRRVNGTRKNCKIHQSFSG